MPVTKLIVSNNGALRSLYGESGLIAVENELAALIKEDDKHGITTAVVYLDNATQMKKLNAEPVTIKDDDPQNKVAIDGVYNALKPDYLAILGAPDIVPMQRLDNPLPGDGDPNVPSDLPYACQGKYSKKITDFLNPTRVIGRITGITGNKTPDALIAALKAAALIQPKNRDKYSQYLAISTEVWRDSSTQTTRKIFGDAGSLQFSPPSGPDWTNSQLDSLSHFVNCHGASNDPKWYGQASTQYPVAMNASLIDHKIRIGTIAAAECCYGGQLYPAPAGTQPGICNTYMANGAAAFCGSSTIAYGPASGQGQADLVTQYFLIGLLGGASAGRAMLQARQDFIRNVNPLGPSDLKTLGQFNVMADPSCHPVAAPMSPAIEAGPKVSYLEVFAAEVGDRRRKLLVEGNALERTAGWLQAVPEAKSTAATEGQLAMLAQKAGLKEWSHAIYQENGGEEFVMSSLQWKGPRDTFHVLHGKLPSNAPFPCSALVVIRERSGKLVTSETQYSKS